MLVENYSNSPGRHTYPVVVRIFIGLRANSSSIKEGSNFLVNVENYNRYVPKIQYKETIIEVPKIEYVEKIEYDDQIEYREVPVDKIVEVKEYRYIPRLYKVEVPEKYYMEVSVRSSSSEIFSYRMTKTNEFVICQRFRCNFLSLSCVFHLIKLILNQFVFSKRNKSMLTDSRVTRSIEWISTTAVPLG